MRPKPSVYRYLDYRAFLRDYYLAGKERGLSYRSISKKAQVKSSNYFKLVIEGKRNLTDKMAVRFGEAVTLEGNALDFFCNLVRFNQADTLSARAAAYERITGSRRYREIRRLDVAQADYHKHWYIPAIRELASQADFKPTAEWVAARLCPAIKKTEARRALETLFALGMLVRGDEDDVVVPESLVTTGPETLNVHVVSYHREMMKMASESLDRFPPKERDISGLTIGLGAEGLSMLKDRVARFRRELLELSELEKDPSQVVQVNFQVFPLSKKGES